VDCFGCCHRGYSPATQIDPAEEWCGLHEDEPDFDREDCPDYYNIEDAKADVKYGHCDRY